jgi:hypothetical protein
VFYQDEVDIHLNPKIGADWGYRGEQRKVATPGQNKKHYQAGALHETITRNHQCKNMDDLLEQVYHFMDTAAPFPGGKHGLKRVYHN